MNGVLGEIVIIIVLPHEEVGCFVSLARARPLIEPITYASLRGGVWLLIDSSSFPTSPPTYFQIA